MLTGLASSIQEVGVMLLSASQSVPLSQLSLVGGALLAVGRALASRRSFNTSERCFTPLSKISFQ